MEELELTQAEHGGTVDLTTDTRLVIALAENRTTGYRWSVDPIDPPIVALVSDEYTIEPGVGYGGAGKRRFVFRVSRSGEARLSLRLVREWDPAAVALRFAVILRVQ